MFKLRYSTDPAWVETVLSNFDAFLIDHAAAEKKASGMALSMVSHYPDKPDIVKAMIDLSIEEMIHFREVVKIMTARNIQLGADTRDEYVNKLRKLMRNGSELYMLDRLLIGGIIEARGCERFGLIAAALPEGELKKFYVAITESEANHENLFFDLARNHFATAIVDERLNELLDAEAALVAELPIIAALH
ncbi:tRNA-(ms[2]io[6]A)-hydroxylase [Teredinibacter waterburyi]|jgi:Hydroxylase for synthesis of 2-methylthio-cis-ribozeatin in tRNA|uniref:tRNA-(ms[2]io[6]A)-hydroxylase n=1 Tax=Teredinibacter waterburyi TaxID=1500538 RepID=UPI00165F2301|nr:tRNA-(ms[2]io[6]A)-hydroxylase [Teredinibacter waterburyi]